jgi:hypothetical protein
MSRRLVGVFVCLLLVVLSTVDTYGRVAHKKISFPLEIETSYFSLDLLDDFGDATQPGLTINWSAREKVTGKLILGMKVRRVILAPPPLVLYELPAQSRLLIHDIFRFQEVFRI